MLSRSAIVTGINMKIIADLKMANPLKKAVLLALILTSIAKTKGSQITIETPNTTLNPMVSSTSDHTVTTMAEISHHVHSSENKTVLIRPDIIVIVGGNDSDHAVPELFDPINQTSCDVLPLPNTTKYAAGAVAADEDGAKGVFPLICGVFNHIILSRCWRLLPFGNWTKTKNMRYSRAYFTMNAINGNIISIGGLHEKQYPQGMRSVEKFDYVQKQWSEIEDIPVNISNHCTITYDKATLIVIAGKQNGKMSKQTWLYDVPQNKWTRGKDIKEPRYGHQCIKLDDMVVIVGGFYFDRFEQRSNKVEFWTQKEGGLKSILVKIAISHHSMVGASGNILVFGGIIANEGMNEEILRLDANYTFSNVSITPFLNPLTKNPYQLKSSRYNPVVFEVPDGYIQSCKVNCKLGNWTIGECIPDSMFVCGNGTRIDTRFEVIAKQYGGENCTGDTKRIESCIIQSCLQQWIIYSGALCLLLISVASAVALFLRQKKKNKYYEVNEETYEDDSGDYDQLYMDDIPLRNLNGNEESAEDDDDGYDRAYIEDMVRDSIPLTDVNEQLTVNEQRPTNERPDRTEAITKVQNPYYDDDNFDKTENTEAEALKTTENPYYDDSETLVIAQVHNRNDYDGTHGYENTNKEEKHTLSNSNEQSTNVVTNIQNPYYVEDDVQSSRNSNTELDVDAIKTVENIYYE